MADARHRVVLLPGDGIGPEVVEAGARVLEAVGAPVTFETHVFGGAAIDLHGVPLPRETGAACRTADAVLLGAVGGPKWDGAETRPESGLLALREELGLFANLRPVQPVAAVAAASSPLRPERLIGVDLLVVRELTSGIYFGQPRGRRDERGQRVAVDTAIYRADEVRRVAELAFRLARGRRGKVTSVDKANVLETSRLWREVVTEAHAAFPEVELEHRLVDAAALELLTNPSGFDVVLTANLFGDILSDESAALAGSLGLLPSASLGAPARGALRLGLFEPVHGSAPALAGTGRANPMGTILSAAMLLEHALGRPDLAESVERAARGALEAGGLTPDLGGDLTTREMTQAVIERLEP
jgi:3-isopropylmalate dehydrogenase